MENAGQSTHPREFEDALMYLPRKAPTGFRKRQIVFDEHHPQGAVHFILRGRVKVDRKSTRLNSSHLGISYAVFCLKKPLEKLLMAEMLAATKSLRGHAHPHPQG